MSAEEQARVGDICATIARMREEVREQEAVLRDKKEELEVAKRNLLNMMGDLGMESVTSGAVKFTRTTNTIPTIDNYDELVEFISSTGAFDLLQKRLAVTAVRERWDEGQGVPGVGWFDKVDLHITAR